MVLQMKGIAGVLGLVAVIVVSVLIATAVRPRVASFIAGLRS